MAAIAALYAPRSPVAARGGYGADAGAGAVVVSSPLLRQLSAGPLRGGGGGAGAPPSTPNLWTPGLGPRGAASPSVFSPAPAAGGGAPGSGRALSQSQSWRAGDGGGGGGGFSLGGLYGVGGSRLAY
jgi:hypothetical protein